MTREAHTVSGQPASAVHKTSRDHNISQPVDYNLLPVTPRPPRKREEKPVTKSHSRPGAFTWPHSVNHSRSFSTHPLFLRFEVKEKEKTIQKKAEKKKLNPGPQRSHSGALTVPQDQHPE